MITPDQIPDEVVEAARRAYYAEKPCGFRESIAAALNAWPEMHTAIDDDEDSDDPPTRLAIILPMPKEPRT